MLASPQGEKAKADEASKDSCSKQNGKTDSPTPPGGKVSDTSAGGRRGIRNTVTNLKTVNFRKREFSIAGGSFYLTSIVTILNKPPAQRTQAELDVVTQMALSQEGSLGKVGFFQSFVEQHGVAQLNKLLRYAYYE